MSSRLSYYPEFFVFPNCLLVLLSGRLPISFYQWERLKNWRTEDWTTEELNMASQFITFSRQAWYCGKINNTWQFHVKHSVHHSIYLEQPHSISDWPAGTVTWSWPWTEEDGQHFCFAVQQCRREEKLNLAESVVLWTKMIGQVFVHSVHLYKKENRAIRSPFVQWRLYYHVNMNEICLLEPNHVPSRVVNLLKKCMCIQHQKKELKTWIEKECD